MRALLALLLCTGCGVPPLKLMFTINTDGDQRCPSANCLDVDLSCDSVISIRILDPARPSAPYLSQCQPVTKSSHLDMCRLVTGLTLDQTSLIPDQTMEVQVVVYPADQIGTDAAGKLICPTEKEGLDFSATGFPSGAISMVDPADATRILTPIAAIGGRSYWHPGDDEVDVALGCNDLAAVNTCEGPGVLDATGTVYDFDTNLPVTAPATVNNLTVRIGEPSHVSGGVDTEFALPAANTSVLAKVADNPPAWGANIDLTFQSSACLEVLEDESQATATVTCKTIDPAAKSVDITGFRLATPSLEKILIGLYGTKTVPARGLTIGIVYDNNLGAKNHTITTVPSGVPIEYLDVDRMTPIPGATQTSASGLFVVRTDVADPTSGAKYGTIFSTVDNKPGSVQAMGGNVDGKITLVVLSLSQLHQN